MLMLPTKPLSFYHHTIVLMLSTKPLSVIVPYYVLFFYNQRSDRIHHKVENQWVMMTEVLIQVICLYPIY